MIFLFCGFSFAFGLTFFFVNTPISLGFWILLISLFISITYGSYTLSWFGFIIFLIYIGGILVIFSYFAAIQPNQDIGVFNSMFYFLLFYQFIPVNCCCFFLDNFKVNYWWIRSIFNYFNIPILEFLGLVLFLALISVVKISINRVAPLRPFKY